MGGSDLTGREELRYAFELPKKFYPLRAMPLYLQEFPKLKLVILGSVADFGNKGGIVRFPCILQTVTGTTQIINENFCILGAFCVNALYYCNKKISKYVFVNSPG